MLFLTIKLRLRLLKLLAITVLIAMIVNCAKKEEVKTYEQTVENGITITSNNGIPADSTFKVVLKEVGFIDIENEDDLEKRIGYARSFDFDKDGNLYILDAKNSKIQKFDKNYNLISIFGGQGQGPGEFVQAANVIVKGDTLLVPDIRSWKVNKLELDGKFIVDKKYSDYQKTPVDIMKFGEGFVNKFRGMTSEETGERYSIEILSLFNSNLEYIKELYVFKELYEPNKETDPSANGIVHASNDKNLFLSVNSKTDYKIDVYDLNGNKIREIRKRYAKINNSDENILKQKERNEKRGTNYLTLFKNSIYGIDTDKYGRLWVRSSVKQEEKEGWKFDIFENDIFLKRIYPDIDKEYIPFFVRDKLITVNFDKNIIKIFDY
jgi:hypothetical protein